jgi:glycerol-3-phosphate dehydrogenase
MNRLAALPGVGGPGTGGMPVPVSSLVRRAPLPGIANPQAVAYRLLADGAAGAGMDPATARQLATHYGSLAFDIARLVHEDPALGERIHPDGPEIWAQVVYARDREWAETVEDVLRRRTTLTVRGLDTETVRERVAGVLAARPV